MAILALLALLDTCPAAAQTGRATGLPVPRYVSLNAERVYVRFGPGKQYPINWVFNRKDLPVQIVGEFDNWRKVRDYEGQEGWIHQSLLSSRLTAMVTGGIRELKRTPSPDARAILRIEPGVIGELLDCAGDWCQVEIQGTRGWLRRTEFWGDGPG
ncbi:MAG: SH3 domain-containing protein [Geminicoccaceae bacterium]